MNRFIKAVGAGVKRARALDRDEAREAMGLAAAGHAEPVQVGAFLLALRMKGETAAELCGFAEAFTPYLTVAAGAPADVLEVDAHGDGHGDRPSLLVAAACAAAALGVRVCLDVERSSRFARHGLDASLASIGLDGVLDPSRAARDLDRAGVAACDLADVCPPLARLTALRPLLGLRTAAQTVVKLLSSFSPPARRRLAGVFHVPYLEVTAAALGELGTERGLVVQALGGLPEARPGKLVRVADASGGPPRTLDLRALSDEDTGVTGLVAAEDEAAAPTPLLDGRAATRAALDGRSPEAPRAAACAGLLLHAATGDDAVHAARMALDALLDGRARAVAQRLRLA